MLFQRRLGEKKLLFWFVGLTTIGAYVRIVLSTSFLETRRKLCAEKLWVAFTYYVVMNSIKWRMRYSCTPCTLLSFTYVSKKKKKNGKLWMAIHGVPALFLKPKFVHTRAPSAVRTNSLLSSGVRRQGCTSRLRRIRIATVNN